MPNFERLTVLRDFLLTVDPKQFDMDTFFRASHPRALPLGPFEPVTREYKCGMAACMAGWACTIPEFQKLGLLLTGRAYDVPIGDTMAVPAFDDEQGFEAMALFFGLTDGESEYLFDNTGYSIVNDLDDVRSCWTPEDGAKHLTAFIEQYDEVCVFIDSEY